FSRVFFFIFFFQAEDGIRDGHVTGVQTCALPISDAFISPAPCRRRFAPVSVPEPGPRPTRSRGFPALAPKPDRRTWRYDPLPARSEERRVGKECRCWWVTGQ